MDKLFNTVIVRLFELHIDRLAQRTVVASKRASYHWKKYYTLDTTKYMLPIIPILWHGGMYYYRDHQYETGRGSLISLAKDLESVVMRQMGRKTLHRIGEPF